MSLRDRDAQPCLLRAVPDRHSESCLKTCPLLGENLTRCCRHPAGSGLAQTPSTAAALAGWVMFAGHGVVGCGGGTSGLGLGGVGATRSSAGGGFQAGVGG